MAYGDILVVPHVTDKYYRYRNGSWDSGHTLPSTKEIRYGIAVNPTTGAVQTTTLAGLAFDKNGNIFTIHSGAVYRNNVSHVALPSEGNSRGIAIDTNGDILVVTSAFKIFRYNGTSWDSGFNTPSGSWPNYFNLQGIAVDTNGDILLVARVGSSGSYPFKIFRYNGTSWDSGFNGPGPDLGGITVDLYVPGEPLAASFPGASSTQAVSVSVTTYLPPKSLTGGILIVDTGTDKIYRYDGSNWDSGLAIPSGEGTPQGLAVDTNGDVLVVGQSTDKIYRYSNGSWDSGFAIPSAEGSPQGLAVDTNGNIFLTGSATKKIFRYNGSSWDSGLSTPNGITPLGVAIDTNGDILFIGSTSPRKIFRYNGTTWDSGFVGPSNNIIGITIDPDNRNILVVDYDSFKIFRYNGTTWDAGISGPSGISNLNPRAVAFDDSGLIFPGAKGSSTFNLTILKKTKAVAASFGGNTASYTATLTSQKPGTKEVSLSLPGIKGSYTLNVTIHSPGTEAVSISLPGIKGSSAFALSNEPQNLEEVTVSFPGEKGSMSALLYGTSNIPLVLTAEFPGAEAGYRAHLGKLELVSWTPAHAENRVPIQSAMKLFSTPTIVCTHATLWADHETQDKVLLAQAEVTTSSEPLRVGEWYTFEVGALRFYQVIDTGGRTSMARRALQGKIGDRFYIQFHDGNPGTDGTANVIQQLTQVRVWSTDMRVY